MGDWMGGYVGGRVCVSVEGACLLVSRCSVFVLECLLLRACRFAFHTHLQLYTINWGNTRVQLRGKR